jgi:hypothetical protein
LTAIREIPTGLATIENLLWIKDLAVAKKVNGCAHRPSIKEWGRSPQTRVR